MGWKSHDQVVEKPQPGDGKVNIVNDADITKPLLDMASRSRYLMERALPQRKTGLSVEC